MKLLLKRSWRSSSLKFKSSDLIIDSYNADFD